MRSTAIPGPFSMVGRGGYKLQKALDVTGWRLEGVTAMDIGRLYRAVLPIACCSKGP